MRKFKLVGNGAELDLADRSKKQGNSIFYIPGAGPRIRLQASKVGEIKIWEIILLYKHGNKHIEDIDQVVVQTPNDIVLKKNAQIIDEITTGYRPEWRIVLVPMTKGFLWISFIATNSLIRSGRIRACYIDTLGEGRIEEGEVM